MTNKSTQLIILFFVLVIIIVLFVNLQNLTVTEEFGIRDIGKAFKKVSNSVVDIAKKTEDIARKAADDTRRAAEQAAAEARRAAEQAATRLRQAQQIAQQQTTSAVQNVQNIAYQNGVNINSIPNFEYLKNNLQQQITTAMNKNDLTAFRKVSIYMQNFINDIKNQIEMLANAGRVMDELVGSVNGIGNAIRSVPAGLNNIGNQIYGIQNSVTNTITQSTNNINSRINNLGQFTNNVGGVNRIFDFIPGMFDNKLHIRFS